MRILAVAMLLVAASAHAQTARLSGDVTPGLTWQVTSPESVGYSGKKLEALRAWLKVQDTSSMMIIVQGRVIFAEGDLAHVSKIASIRKSILGMLFGNYVVAGKVDPYKSIVDLGLEEKTPFLPIEMHATLEQLMAGRSGYYGASDDLLPRRGSHYPGSYFVYQNWDFNAAGTLFEKLTGKTIYGALAGDLAAPLGMQDFSLDRQRKFPDPDSLHPEYAMYLSARDLARIGLLMLDLGNWNGKQVVPADWVRYLTTLVTPFRDVHPEAFANPAEPARWGFGYTWWVWDQPAFPGNVSTGFLQGAYSGMGTGGQFLTILPARDMVVVHRVDIDKNEKSSVSPSSYIAMLSMIENSRCSESCP